MTKVPTDRVVVIGGGVIGAMCAWYLNRAGSQVTIVDQAQFGSGCSHGNCGYVAPSHVLPLPRPGVIGKTLGAMLKRNSAFAIKPRLSGDLIRWFWNFSRHCNHRDMMSAAAGRNELLRSSKQLFEELLANENIQCEWQAKGLLFVFDNAKQFEGFRETNDLLSEHFDVSATPYRPDQLVALEPALKSGFGGGWHFEGDCHIRPDMLMTSMKGKLLEVGTQIVEQTKVRGFVRNNHSRAIAVATSDGNIEADQFVVATGAWTPFLNEHLGCNIPIEPGKGYSITMPTPERMPKIPLIFESTHVAITPMQTKYRIGSTMEFVGYDTSINPKRVALLRSVAAKYLHEPYCDPIEEEWFGWRPMTWDGKPIIDRSPSMENVWIAAGHNMLGLSMATGTGKLLAELMLDLPTHIDPSHFSIEQKGIAKMRSGQHRS